MMVTFGLWPRPRCSQRTPIQGERCSDRHGDNTEGVVPECLGESGQASIPSGPSAGTPRLPSV